MFQEISLGQEPPLISIDTSEQVGVSIGSSPPKQNSTEPMSIGGPSHERTSF